MVHFLALSFIAVLNVFPVVVVEVQCYRYDGDQVFEVTINSTDQLADLQRTIDQFGPQVSRWRPPIVSSVCAHVHVSSSVIDLFTSRLDELRLSYTTIINDLQRIIDDESRSNQIGGIPLPWSDDDVTLRRRRDVSQQRHQRRESTRRRRRQTIEAGSIVGKYATYEEISAWLYDIQNQFSDIASVINIGKTFEGRDLLVLKISFDGPYISKPGMWVDAGTHAREWISPSSAVYIIYTILSAYYNNTAEYPLVRSVDWYILPVLNPDGYAWTFNPNGTRLWRKNRSTYGNLSYSDTYQLWCHGTDINRNYNIQWNTVDTADDPCIETYGGPSAMSENETQAVTSFILAHNDTIRGTITLHSYGQLFLTRWAYSNDEHAPEYNQTLLVTQEAVEAINDTSGVAYLAGTAPELLYAFSGGAADWARAAAGVKHSYEVELRDHGVLGFILPANYVIPIGQEIWAAVKVVVFHVSQDNPPVYLAHSTSVLTVSPISSSTPGSVPRSSTPGLETASRSFDHGVLNSAQMFYNSIVLIVGLLLIGRTVLCMD